MTKKTINSTFDPKKIYQDLDGTWMTLSEVLREFTELRVTNFALHDLLFRNKISVKDIAAATHAARKKLYDSGSDTNTTTKTTQEISTAKKPSKKTITKPATKKSAKKPRKKVR